MCRYPIRWSTASGNAKHDLLRDSILNKLGINRSDIVSGSLQPSISTPTQPFIVDHILWRGRPLAGPGHEMCISSCISFQTINGNTYKSEELYFKDDGHRRLRDRFFGIFHYNVQVRLTDENGIATVYGGEDPITEDHIISGARYIELNMPPAGNVQTSLYRKIKP